MGDLEGIQCAFQRRVFLIQSKKAVFREGHCGRIAGEFFQTPGKGAGLRRAQQAFDVGADFALEAQGIGPVMVHGQQEHGGEHVGVGGLPDVEARIARLHARGVQLPLKLRQVRVEGTDTLYEPFRISQIVDTLGDGPVRARKDSVQFIQVILYLFFDPRLDGKRFEAFQHVFGKTPGLDFLHDSEVDETVAAQDAVVEDALRPLALLADVGSDGHVGQSDVDGFVRLFGQHLEELEQRNEERAQHEAEQPEQQGDAGGDALVHDAHGRFQQASSSGERTPKG